MRVCVCGVCVLLESVSRTYVFKLLGDLWRSTIQLLGHTLLLVRVHGVKLLTQVPINHILQKKRGTTISNVSSLHFRY